jgi:two-component system, OmpR family, phosphate regulon sensor histidine kinase PhoR
MRSVMAPGVGARGPVEWLASPRGFQIGFTALFAIDVLIRGLVEDSFAPRTGPAVALAIVVATLVAALVVPWSRFSATVVMVLPLLDLVAVGLNRLTPAGGNGLLAVLPALWLGRQLGRTGVVVTAVGTVVAITLPALVYGGTDPVNASRLVLIPVTATLAAFAIAEGIAEARHERRVSQAIFDAVDVGLLLLDAQGRYVGSNRRHQQFMDVAFPAGHEGRAGQLGEVFDVDGRTPLVREHMPTYRATRGEEFDDVRMWIGTDRATRRALSVSARVVRDDSGAIAGAALGYTDVTDFMQALRVKDEFVALVSHELRTPLTSIVGYVQLLDDDPSLSAQARRQLAIVHRNAQRLHRLIADLLDTAQRDGRPMPITREDADLARIVVDAVEAARPQADAARVTLAVSAPPRLRMRLDAERVAQVVDNLVSNAIKYTEAGGSVEVRLDSDGGWALLGVADSGIGISPEDCERLFTRFFRTEDAARRAVAGAGLGLSITKDIVVSHGGRIEVESELGRGSLFRVRLPR